MNPGDPLAQLRDIHLPEPVSWWPPAPGWWVVAFLMTAAAVIVLFVIRRQILRRRYRKIALKKLSSIDVVEQGNTQEVLEQISVILRRVAIQSYGRQSVSHLAGNAWLLFLDRTGKTTGFTEGAASILGTGLYQPAVEADIAQVLESAKKWIKEHGT